MNHPRNTGLIQTTFAIALTRPRVSGGRSVELDGKGEIPPCAGSSECCDSGLMMPAKKQKIMKQDNNKTTSLESQEARVDLPGCKAYGAKDLCPVAWCRKARGEWCRNKNGKWCQWIKI